MLDPQPDPASAYPEVGRALRECVDPILGRWADQVAGRLPSADRLTHTQLRDHLPKMLNALADALEEAGADPVEAIAALASKHGQERFHESYSVNELLVEYGMLRPIVLDELATLLVRPLMLDELASLNEGLDAALRHSVDRFVADQARQIQSVNEAQAKYLAYLSHDLRGGLNGVMLMAEVLGRSLGEDETARDSLEDLASMRASIAETVQTMDAFLQAERLRRGSVVPTPMRSNLGDLLRRAVAQFPVQAARRGVQVQVEIDDEIVIEIDRGLLNLILTNILSNAVRHSPRGQTVRAVLRLVDERYARISIVDYGSGLSAHRQVGLFRSPARSTTEQGSAGTGLLAAGQAAGLLGIALSVDSQPNAGATFHLTIPIQ